MDNKKATTILALGILGVIISWAKFLAWISANGVDPIGGFREAFTASVFGAGLVWDLSFSAVIIMVAAVWDRRRLGTRWLLGVIAAAGIAGVCLGLPVYLIGVQRSSSES